MRLPVEPSAAESSFIHGHENIRGESRAYWIGWNCFTPENSRGSSRHFSTRALDFAVAPAALQEFLNLNEQEFREQVSGLQKIRALTLEGEKLYTTEKKWDQLRDDLLQKLKDYHAAHPLAPGMDMEEARDKLRYEVPPRVFRAFLEQLEAGKAIARDGNFLRLPRHRYA